MAFPTQRRPLLRVNIVCILGNYRSNQVFSTVRYTSLGGLLWLEVYSKHNRPNTRLLGSPERVGDTIFSLLTAAQE